MNKHVEHLILTRNLATIVLAVFLSFSLALNGGFAWDDGAMTTSPLLKSIGGLASFWVHPAMNANEEHYWPLVYAVFWVEHWLWNLNPFCFHLVNVLLHAANACLLWQILRKLEVSGAMFCALLFGVHPTRVESVAWVIELKDVLSGFFYLLAFWLYWKHRETRNERTVTRTLFLSLFFFLCGMLSKSIVVTLPPALLLVVWWKENRIAKRDVLEADSYAILGAAVLAIDFLTISSHPDRAHIVLSWPARFIVAGRAWWFYLWKLAWPVNLMAVYPSWEIETSKPGQYLYPVSVIVVLAGLFIARKRISRAPFTAAAFLSITLLPVLGFVSFGYMQWAYVADRFQYLAAIGPMALVSSYGTAFALRITKGQRRLTEFMGFLLLFTLSNETRLRAGLYGDAETLFRDNLKRNPESWVVHLNLAKALDEKHKFAEACTEYGQAIKFNPQSWLAHYNLAYMLSEQGMKDEAAKHYEAAIRIRPNYADAHVNLGHLLRDQHKPETAIPHYETAMKVRPNDPWIHYSLFLCAMDMKNIAEAKSRLNEAIQLDPGNPDFQAAKTSLKY